MTFVIFVAGLVILTLGADLLVRGASRLAISFGISPLVVGLTIVAFGTSAPELAVSVGAALKGTTDIAVGNVVGSNIFNVLGILGLSALIAPLVVDVQLIRQEVPIMLGASLLMMVMGLDGKLGLVDCAILAGLLLTYTGFLIVQSRRAGAQAEAGFEEQILESTGALEQWMRKTWVQVLLVAAGLGGLVLGAQWLVEASVSFAKAMGVSDLIIGLTIVAVGTSLPEAATSIVAAVKGERDLAVGNIVGSNTFNILGCLGISGLAAGSAGLPIAPSLLAFDIWVMIAAAMACIPVFLTGREIARWEGGVFFTYYVAYVVYLVLVAQKDAALGVYTTAMTSFAVPLTVITLVVVMIRNTPPPR